MSTKTTPKLRVKRVYWKDVRAKVAKLQPEFAEIVDELDPGEDFPLYIAKYRYGDLIVDEGLFHLPTEEGGLIPITSPEIPSDLYEQIGYGKYRIAPGIVLNRAMELFVKPKGRVLPWKYYVAGTIFGLWGYLDRGYIDDKPSYHPAKVFSITAGAKSAFLIPSVGDAAYHHSLESSLRCRFPLTKTLVGQHDLFVKLSKHPDVKCKWNMEVMFFGKAWGEKLVSRDKAWMWLRLVLLNNAWNSTAYWRNQQLYDFAFSWAQANRDLKENPYLVDTARHLITMAMGHSPGFAPVMNDEAGPFTKLQRVFLNNYRIKYNPVFLSPSYFTYESRKSKPVYYSLQMPTAWEFSPPSKRYTITLQDLRELKYIIKVFIEEICQGKLSIEDTPAKKAVEASEFGYFHTKADAFYEIEGTDQLPVDDNSLTSNMVGGETKPFAYAGPFLRGCIRVMKKRRK